MNKMNKKNKNVTDITEQLEQFARRKLSAMPPEQRALIETLTIINAINAGTLQEEQLVSALRSTSMIYRNEAPYLSAGLDMVADEIEPDKRTKQ